MRTYKDSSVGDSARRKSNEAKGQDDPINDIIHDTQGTEHRRGDHSRDPLGKEPVQGLASQEPAGQRSLLLGPVIDLFQIVLGLDEPLLLVIRGGRSSRTAGAMAAVARPAVLVHGARGIRFLMVSHILGRNGKERSPLVLSTATVTWFGVDIDQADDDLGDDHRADNPSDLVVGIVLVQVRRGRVVDETEKHADSVDDEEQELRGNRVPRMGHTEHDRYSPAIVNATSSGVWTRFRHLPTGSTKHQATVSRMMCAIIVPVCCPAAK